MICGTAQRIDFVHVLGFCLLFAGTTYTLCCAVPQLMEGEKYVQPNPAICLVFLGFALDKREGYLRRVVAWDETHEVAFSEHLDLVLVEMPKFSQADLEKVSDERERWLCFLKEGQTMATDVVEGWKTPEIIEAMEELKKLSNDRAWREGYNDREKALRDYISMMSERYEEGIEKGKLDVALRLLEVGMEMEQIAKVTGLSTEAIAKLQAQAVGEPPAKKEEG